MEGWTVIYTTPELYKAELVKGMLSEYDIPSIILNKQDSSYGTFGEVELYVQTEFVLRAVNLIRNNEL